jgi:cyclin-dependent kinase
MWSVGCILYEIAHKKCLFCGDSEIDQLFKIFKILGTPTNKTWPDVLQLKDFKATFPKWSKNELEDINSKLSENGFDLLQKMLTYDPIDRITCEEALQHPYFDSIDKS